jgi:hypothetical protein
MTTANWNTTGGNWFTASNWDEPGNQHFVPGASDDAVIPDNSVGTPFTITYNGTSTIHSLQGANPEDTLDIAGGSLTLANGGSFNSMDVDVDAGATLGVTAGTLVITGGDYAGTLSGNGAFSFVYGTFNLNAGVSITAAIWVLGVTTNGTFSTTNLNTDLSYAHTFTLGDLSGNHAVLNLNNHTLTLSGTANIDGTIVGPGTVLVTGSAVQGSGGYGAPIIKGGATLEYANGSTGTQHLNTALGDGLANGTASPISRCRTTRSGWRMPSSRG